MFKESDKPLNSSWKKIEEWKSEVFNTPEASLEKDDSSFV